MAEEITRRSVIGGMLASAAAVNAEAGEDLFETVRRDAERLAASMQALHGGKWAFRVSHETGYASVSRSLS